MVYDLNSPEKVISKGKEVTSRFRRNTMLSRLYEIKKERL